MGDPRYDQRYWHTQPTSDYYTQPDVDVKARIAGQPTRSDSFHSHLQPSPDRSAVSVGGERSQAGIQTSMQPTFEGLIFNTMDALVLVEACLQGKKAHLPRRPHDKERTELIRSGAVFVFEENASGIKRWTDGYTWSPSRIMGNALIYRELEKPFPPGEKKRAAKRKRDCGEEPSVPSGPQPTSNGSVTPQAGPSGAGVTSNLSDEERKWVGSLVDSYGFKKDGLIKKTFNFAWKGTTHHVVAYYTLEDAMKKRFKKVTEHPDFRGIQPRREFVESQNFRSPLTDGEEGEAASYALVPQPYAVQSHGIPFYNYHGSWPSYPNAVGYQFGSGIQSQDRAQFHGLNGIQAMSSMGSTPAPAALFETPQTTQGQQITPSPISSASQEGPHSLPDLRSIPSTSQYGLESQDSTAYGNQSLSIQPSSHHVPHGARSMPMLSNIYSYSEQEQTSRALPVRQSSHSLASGQSLQSSSAQTSNLYQDSAHGIQQTPIHSTTGSHYGSYPPDQYSAVRSSGLPYAQDQGYPSTLYGGGYPVNSVSTTNSIHGANGVHPAHDFDLSQGIEGANSSQEGHPDPEVPDYKAYTTAEGGSVPVYAQPVPTEQSYTDYYSG